MNNNKQTTVDDAIDKLWSLITANHTDEDYLLTSMGSCVATIRKALQAVKDGECPRGDKCDLTVAYMCGQADEAKRHREPQQDQKDRVMEMMGKALRIYCQGRCSSDTEYAREALAEYAKIKGE